MGFIAIGIYQVYPTRIQPVFHKIVTLYYVVGLLQSSRMGTTAAVSKYYQVPKHIV